MPNRLRAAALVIAACCAHSLSSQVAPLPSGASRPDGETLVLSPFTVEASDEQGYRANNTLSGTRLKASLADIPASVSVFTKDFLDDIGATSIQDAYLYSVSTENENEFARNDTEGDDVSSQNMSRVRGLVASSSTRGFFETRFRADGYNSERYTVARGPNSILYGIGSPAGLVDQGVKQARLNANSYEFAFRFDSEEGHRSTVDFNQVILKNRLAFRFAGLEQLAETWRDPERDDEARRYYTVTFKPFKTTTIRASYETMTAVRSKARAKLAFQDFSHWAASGKPFYDHMNDRISYDQGATWSDTVLLPSGQRKTLASLTEPEQHSIGIDRDNGGQFALGERRSLIYGQIQPPASAWSAIQDPATRALYEKFGFQALIFFDGASTVGNSDPSSPLRTFSDESIVPANHNIHGLASSTRYRGNNKTITIEQQIARGLHVELGYNRENWSRYFLDPIRSENAIVRVDINYYIPLWTLPRANGQPTMQWITRPNANTSKLRNPDGSFVMIKNPNVGRYYVEGQPIGFHEIVDQENLRFTTSYELDLTRKSKWFGRHGLAALVQKDNIDYFQRKLRLFNAHPMHLGVGSNAAAIAVGQNNISPRYYLDFPGQPSSGPNSIQYAPPFQRQPDDYWPMLVGGWSGDGRPVNGRRELTGKMAVLQSHWLSGRLVTTFGFRNDKEEQFRGPVPSERDRDPVTGEFMPTAIPGSPFYVGSGNTRTMGAVFKATKQLSFFYNDSNSFQPMGQFHGLDNEPLPPANGQGKDYGFMVDLMEGKVSARVGWYEQSAQGSLELDWRYNRAKNTVVSSFENFIEDWWEVMDPQRTLGVPPAQDMSRRLAWAQSLGLSFEDYKPESTNFSDYLRMVRDFTARGMEIEVHAKPFKNFDIVFNVAKTESVNERSMPDLVDYVDRRQAVWEKYYNLPKVPTNVNYVPDIADPSKDNPTWNPKYDGNDKTFVNRTEIMGNQHLVAADGLAIVALAKAEQGMPNTRTRKWRSNLVANYRFTEGKLRGLGIGGAVRWRDRAGIGNYGMTNPVNPQSLLLVPDPTRPIYGPEQLDIDAWLSYNWRFRIFSRGFNLRSQINVRNVFNDTSIYPVLAHTDGSILEYDKKAPRVWMITNTLKF